MWLYFALIAAILWGFNYALAERILSHISAFTLLAFEMLVGAVIFSILSYCYHLKRDLILLKTIPHLALITTCEVVVVSLASYFICISVQAKNATMSGIIELIYPIFIIFFSWLLFDQNHVTPLVIIGGLFIFIGVILLIIP